MIVIKTYPSPNAASRILNELYAKHLFSADGMFQDFYRNPDQFALGEIKVCLEYDKQQRVLGAAVVGKGVFYSMPMKDKERCWGFAGVYVHPESRRKGIATRLLEKLFEDSKNTYMVEPRLFKLVHAKHRARAISSNLTDEMPKKGSFRLVSPEPHQVRA